MVTRLPSPNNPVPVPAPLRQAANNPPYPTESTMPRMDTADNAPSFEHIHSQGPSAPNGTQSRSRASSVSSHGTWNTDPSEPDLDDREESEVPEALRPGSKVNRKPVARPGHAIPPPNVGNLTNGDIQDSSTAWQQAQPRRASPSFLSQNPYLSAQESTSPPPYQSHVPPPGQTTSFKPPSEELADLMLGSSPTQDAVAAPSQPPPAPPPQVAAPPSNILPHHTGGHNSQNSNPWQQDLDREQQRLEVQKTGVSSGASSSTPNAPHTPPKNKQPATATGAPPPLLLSGVSAQTVSKPDIDTPRTKATKQRNEFYHIKHVNWHDATAQGGRGALRRSPILTQNANGPCPILALVNALSLSTPEHEDTALVHTLKSREQVTLGLLLDAVFEELVRRNETTNRDLPDIGDLYSFLITLHTGMNVNPDFTRQSAAQPGGFEQTREMQLYSAFHIPLVHGWTCPFRSDTYQAFERSAKTFDEALNVQFLEEEFDAKLQAGGLSKEEQQVFEDLTCVKRFLTTFPTQLSEYGLDALSSWMQPGQVAILFRNDHFCTLYKEPTQGTLMTLVTDAGYATHDEVVWESLVDVNGAGAELFSGDFRSVGASRQGSATMEGGSSSAGWSSARPDDGKSAAIAKQSSQPISQSEQEDLDLALALQLQEEEEEASRREEARRQSELNESLSRQYIDRQSFGSDSQRPSLPPRRSHAQPQRTSPQRSSTPRRTSTPQQRAPTPQTFNSSSRTDDGNAPPPTYEQAASDMPYREAGSTPRPPQQGNALGALSALDAQRQQSAFTAQSPQQGPVMAPNYGRRRSGRFGSYTQAGPNIRYTNQQQTGPNIRYTDDQQTGPTGPNIRYTTSQDDNERCIIM